MYGSNRYLYEVVRRLDPARFRPTVLVPGRGPFSEHLERAGIDVVYRRLSVLNNKHRLSEVAEFFALFGPGIASVASLVRNRRIALVHTNTCHLLAGALAAALLRIPHVWHIHERDISPAALRKSLSAAVLRLSAKVVTASTECGKQFFGERRSPKLRAIPGGVDPDRFHPGLSGRGVRAEFRLPEAAPVVGMIGRITPWKGQAEFLEAARRIRDAVPEARFLVVGAPDVAANDRYEGALRSLVAELGIQDAVVFTGQRDDVPQIIAALDVLVLPSVEPEPFGLVLVEAMAEEKPVVATAIGGPLEIVSPGDTGFLVPPKDPGAMAAAVLGLLADSPLRTEMGRRGRARALERFTWERAARDLEACWSEALRGKQGA
ncbi:MAG: glycosyltransferase family 4 protein [Deltaproteobacteria bacterium]|nr:glycosyltransferase family 4 protein [Deltaproteobacteria bacterium]